jgi:hypothetical protein
MFEKLKNFHDKFVPSTSNQQCRQVIVYCTQSNLSHEDYVDKIDHVSKASISKANEMDYDIWCCYCYQDTVLLMCNDFLEMDELYEKAVYGVGVPASFICNRDNNMIMMAIGPAKIQIIDNLVKNFDYF